MSGSAFREGAVFRFYDSDTLCGLVGDAYRHCRRKGWALTVSVKRGTVFFEFDAATVSPMAFENIDQGSCVFRLPRPVWDCSSSREVVRPAELRVFPNSWLYPAPRSRATASRS